MPGINGLIALSEIHRMEPQAVLVILSAYDNFSYAQEAIRLNVFEYLVKPVNKAQLLATVEKARRRLAKIRADRQEELALREKYQRILPLIESEFLHALITGVDEASFHEYLDLLGISFASGFFMAVSYTEQNRTDFLAEMELNYMRREKMADFAERIRDLFPCFIGPVRTDPIIVFIPLSGKNEGGKIQECGYAHRILTYFQREKKITGLQIGVGRSYSSPAKLKCSYHEALQALKFGGNTPVIHFADLSPGKEKGWESELDRVFHDIYDAIRFGNQTKTELLWNKISAGYAFPGNEERDKIYFALLQFLLTAYQIAKESTGEGNLISPSYLRITGIFDDRKDLAAILREIGEEILYLTRAVKEGREDKIKTVIIQAKEIVDRQFHEHLTLQGLAEKVNVSPYYLSRLFREELGESFSEYLTKLRMAKALELLGKGLSVKDCCFSVGYNDPNYFSRIFRKYYDIAPSEYREKQYRESGDLQSE